MKTVERYVGKMFHFDTNRINSRGKLKFMNQLDRWHKDGVIIMGLSAVAAAEAAANQNQKRVNKTFEYLSSKTAITNQIEIDCLREIELILFPGGVKNPNQGNDVEIVFNAWKYSSILITADGGSNSQPGGILGHKGELKNLGIDVMTDEEAVVFVRQLIKRRDDFAMMLHQDFKEPLTDWVGKDTDGIG